jgi:hypothetical protein
MNFDDVLFGLILCGIGLASACFKSEYVLLRELRATERRKERVLRELHLERLSQPFRSSAAQTAVVNAAQLMIDAVARPEDA